MVCHLSFAIVLWFRSHLSWFVQTARLAELEWLRSNWNPCSYFMFATSKYYSQAEADLQRITIMKRKSKRLVTIRLALSQQWFNIFPGRVTCESESESLVFCTSDFPTQDLVTLRGIWESCIENESRKITGRPPTVPKSHMAVLF